jgi:phospholipid transport system substrate-binding protein
VGGCASDAGTRCGGQRAGDGGNPGEQGAQGARRARVQKPAEGRQNRQDPVDRQRDLLEKTYADRLLSYSDEKVVFEKESMLREGQAEVTSNVLTADGKKIPLDYRLIQKDGNWRVYDVIIEGISLVKNYRDQFRDIMAKDSPEEVIKMLRDKAAKG